MSFTSPVDIANRALQHLGVLRITSFTDQTQQANEAQFCYDKLRRAELRRAVWNFATRRAVLRSITSTTKTIVPSTYNPSTTYVLGDIVVDSAGFWWLSTSGSNTGNTPGSETVNPHWVAYFGPAVADAWSGSVQYFPGDTVYLSTTPYIAVAASLNNTPPNTTYWEPLTSGVLATLALLSPIGYSPNGATLRKLFQLPKNFMRLAPQDPKAAATPRQQVTAGQRWNDWEIESGYLSTAATSSPIVLRFVADVTDVTLMDDMYCEGLAARMAVEMAEPLTQDPKKAEDAMTVYTRYIGEARSVSAIEAGTTEEEEEAVPQPAQGGVPANRGG